MRILIITDYFYRKSHIGGGDIVARYFKEGLEQKGHNVLLVCCKGDNFYDVKDLSVKRIFTDIKNYNKDDKIGLVFNLCKDYLSLNYIVWRFRPELLICLQMDGLSVPTIKYISNMEFSKIFRLGSEWPRIFFEERIKNWNSYLTITPGTIIAYMVNKLNTKFIFNAKETRFNSNMVICNSNFMVERNSKYFNASANKIVIRNGIDLHKFQLIRKTSLSRNKLLYVGRVSKQKGIYLLIETMNYLYWEIGHKDYVLSIVGWTDKEEDANEVRSTIERYKLSKVIHLEKTVQHDELPSIYHKHDIFVFPSIRRNPKKSQEGCPSVLLEAMATGTPIVARIEKGLDEILEDNVNCLGVFEDHPKMLGEAILKLANNRMLYDKILKNAYDYVNKYHNIEDMIDKIDAIINDPRITIN